jgi:aspartate racemase
MLSPTSPATAGRSPMDPARVPDSPEPAGPAPASALRSALASPATVPGGAAPPRPRAVIGVMGGMGPAAANDFGRKLIELKAEATSDQQHARMLLDQATDIPDRTAAILRGGASPVERMQASLKRLDRGGADVVAITCNTAHHFFADMQSAIDRFGLGLELMHIVDATMAELDRQAPGATKIGLLATSGTLQSGIYQHRATELGQEREWIVPDAQIQQQRVMHGIYQGVKAGDLDGGREHLLAAARDLQQNGAQAILLACTEIPLVLHAGDLMDDAGRELPLIDTLGALAKQALAKAEAGPPDRAPAQRGCFDVEKLGLTGFLQSASALIGGTPERARRVGVIGGMGPAAAMQFSDYMVKLNNGAKSDQQHVPLLLDQATDIPDRTAAIRDGQTDPTPQILASLRRLARAGADEIVMTCNTAHHFFPAVQQAIESEQLAVNPIHIVDATMKLLDQQAPGAKVIGLLATSGTVETGIYQQRAADRQWLVPEPASQDDEVMTGIYRGVKAGDLDQGGELLRRAAERLAERGADAILLACTEIPLVLKTGDIRSPQGDVVPLIDTLEAQALEAIARAREPVPATPGLVQQVRQWLAARLEQPPADAPSGAPA